MTAPMHLLAQIRARSLPIGDVKLPFVEREPVSPPPDFASDAVARRIPLKEGHKDTHRPMDTPSCR